jgi:hypothetical protein
VVATREGARCVVTVTASSSASSSSLDARPLVFGLSGACAVTEDPTQQRPLLASIDGMGAAGGADTARTDARESLFTPSALSSETALLPATAPRTERAHRSCACAGAGAGAGGEKTTSLLGGVAALLGAATLALRRRRGEQHGPSTLDDHLPSLARRLER